MTYFHNNSNVIEGGALSAAVDLDAALKADPAARKQLSPGQLFTEKPGPARAIQRHMIRTDWSPAQRAYDNYLREGTESRDLGVSGASGGYLIAPGFDSDVLRGLTFQNALLSRCRIWVSDSGAPATLPLAGADVSIIGTQIGELTQASESDFALTQAVFASTPLYIMRGFQRIGRALLQDEHVNLPALISDIMSARLTRALDHDFMATLLAGGFGVTTTASPTAVTYPDLAAWVDSLDAAYRYAPGSAVIVSPATAAVVRAMVDTASRPLTLNTPYISQPFDNSIAGGTDRDAQSLRFPSILGMPILESPNVSSIGASNVVGICGDFSRAFVARFPADSFSILRLEERYAEFGSIGFIGYSRADGVVGLTSSAQILKCHA